MTRAKTSNLKILFLTIGVGGADFEAAALRLQEQAESFNFFTKTYAALETEVLEICPRLQTWFTAQELQSTKGFGWYTWKSTVAYEAIVSNRWGEFDLVMYLDSGCEMFKSRWSKRRLTGYIREALESGRVLFSIPTPELSYTKRDLFDHFPAVSSEDWTDQFQSGSWILAPTRNQEFVNQWENIAKIGIETTDESPSKKDESPDFIVHRYDQSIFSLICKSNGYVAHSDLPPGNTSSLKSKIRAFSYPFWWSRNRTGRSIIPRWMSLLGKLI